MPKKVLLFTGPLAKCLEFREKIHREQPKKYAEIEIRNESMRASVWGLKVS